MRYKSKIFIVLLIIISFTPLSAQDKNKQEVIINKITEDTILTRAVDCNALFTLNNRKVDYLDKKPYVYTEPYYLRAYNSKKDYAVFQLGKRKSTQPFLYVHIFTFNTCIKKDEVIEFILENGLRYRMDNIFDPNCDGYVVSRIKKKDLQVLTGSNVNSVKILTFEKDFEFHLTEEEADRMKDELQCLKYNQFKFQ